MSKSKLVGKSYIGNKYLGNGKEYALMVTHDGYKSNHANPDAPILERIRFAVSSWYIELKRYLDEIQSATFEERENEYKLYKADMAYNLAPDKVSGITEWVRGALSKCSSVIDVSIFINRALPQIDLIKTPRLKLNDDKLMCDCGKSTCNNSYPLSTIMHQWQAPHVKEDIRHIQEALQVIAIYKNKARKTAKEKALIESEPELLQKLSEQQNNFYSHTLRDEITDYNSFIADAVTEFKEAVNLFIGVSGLNIPMLNISAEADEVNTGPSASALPALTAQQLALYLYYRIKAGEITIIQSRIDTIREFLKSNNCSNSPTNVSNSYGAIENDRTRMGRRCLSDIKLISPFLSGSALELARQDLAKGE